MEPAGFATGMVVHWPPGCGLAQCGDLLGHRQLPPTGNQPAGLPDAHPKPLAGHHDRPDRPVASRELEAPVGTPAVRPPDRHRRFPAKTRQSPVHVPGHALRLPHPNCFAPPPIPSPWNPRPQGAANQAAERRQNRSPWREPWVRRRQNTTEPRRGDENPRAADLTRKVIRTEIEPDHPQYRDTLSSTIPTPPHHPHHPIPTPRRGIGCAGCAASR